MKRGKMTVRKYHILDIPSRLRQADGHSFADQQGLSLAVLEHPFIATTATPFPIPVWRQRPLALGRSRRIAEYIPAFFLRALQGGGVAGTKDIESGQSNE